METSVILDKSLKEKTFCKNGLLLEMFAMIVLGCLMLL